MPPAEGYERLIEAVVELLRAALPALVGLLGVWTGNRLTASRDAVSYRRGLREKRREQLTEVYSEGLNLAYSLVFTPRYDNVMGYLERGLLLYSRMLLVAPVNTAQEFHEVLKSISKSVNEHLPCQSGQSITPFILNAQQTREVLEGNADALRRLYELMAADIKVYDHE